MGDGKRLETVIWTDLGVHQALRGLDRPKRDNSVINTCSCQGYGGAVPISDFGQDGSSSALVKGVFLQARNDKG